jgi:hypothetical protein
VGQEPQSVTGLEADAPEAALGPSSSLRRTMFWLTLGTLVYLGGQWPEPEVSSGQPS